MLTMAVKYLYVFLLAFLGTASSIKLISSSASSVTSTYDRTAEIIYVTNFTGTNYAMKFLLVEILKPVKKTIASGSSGAFLPDSKTNVFGLRLSAYSNENTGYTIKIHKLRYSDQYTFRASVYYRKPNDNAMHSEAFSVELFVQGGPTLCSTNILKPKTYISVGGPAMISMIICGNPKPSVLWSLNGTALIPNLPIPILYTNTSTLVGKSRYTYNVTFLKPKTSMCGMKLSYSATGFIEELKGETQLHVNFQPNVTLKYTYRLNSSCIRTVWIPVNIGTCKGVQYHIQYMNVSGIAIYTTTAQNDSSQFDYCPQGGYGNINYTRVRGSFNQYVGTWTTKYDVSLTTPAPPATPYVIPVAAKSKKDKVTIPAAIGGSIGGIILITIIVIIIFCCCCREKKESRNVVSSDSLGFQYKKNSKKKDKYAKGNGIAVINNTGASGLPVMYATVEKDKNEMKFFDPNEFGLETTPVEDVVPNDHSSWQNDEGSAQKPTFLI